MNAERFARFWPIFLIFLTILSIAPFLEKAPHIDEESYLFIAREISDHPLRPYDWLRAWQPVGSTATDSFIYAHPPLFLWILSILGRGVGFGAVETLRLLMLPFSLLLISSYAGICRGMLERPGLAATAFLFSPAILLVLHQSLMIDLPFVALSTASVYVLFEANRRRRPELRWIAGLLLGLAALCKYPALILLPLAFFSHKIDDNSGSFRLDWRYLIGTLALFLPWELYTWWSYGQPHLIHVLLHADLIERTSLVSRGLGNLAQLGASVLPPPLLALALFFSRGRHLRLLGGVVLAFVLVGALFLVPAPGDPPLPGLLGRMADNLVGQVPRAPAHLVLLGVFFLLGICAVSIFRARGIDRFLSVWALLVLAACVFGHNFAGARYLAPAAAPLHLLFWRRLARETWPRRWMTTAATACGASLALWIAFADLELSEVYPEMARQVEGQVKATAVQADRVRFMGEWGFRREMSTRGYRYLEPNTSLEAGDLLIIPSVAGPGHLDGLPPASAIFKATYGQPGLRTMAPRSGIGYYSEAFGLLPYGWTEEALETVTIWEIRGAQEYR